MANEKSRARILHACSINGYDLKANDVVTGSDKDIKSLVSGSSADVCTEAVDYALSVNKGKVIDLDEDPAVVADKEKAEAEKAKAKK